MPAPSAVGDFSKLLQLSADFGVIVDLAVVADDKPAIGGVHRLMTLRRQVDDRQPAMGKSDPSFVVSPDALIVRPSVGNGASHTHEQRRIDAVSRKYAGNSAH